MEKVYKFLGEEYNLEEVAAEVDKTLQNMINDLAGMQGLYKSIISEFRMDTSGEKDEVTQNCLKLFDAFKANVEKNHTGRMAKLEEIIDNNDYEKMLEVVEETAVNFDRAVKGLDKVLQESIDVPGIDNLIRYTTLTANKDSIKYALKELQRQKEYTRKYAQEHDAEAGLE